jgi:hypothetical protein
MTENNDKENIEKLLSMQIERKMRTKVASEDVVSFDEFVSFVSLSGGMPEWKIREAFRALTVTMKDLYHNDREQFIEIMKTMTGADGIIIDEDDT